MMKSEILYGVLPGASMVGPTGWLEPDNGLQQSLIWKFQQYVLWWPSEKFI